MGDLQGAAPRIWRRLDELGEHDVEPRWVDLVGLIFDGNIHSLTFNYAYSEQRARSVSVHSQAMWEVMDKVYQAKELLEELR